LDAYDHLLRGKYCHHLETADANREAESHFDRSIELDPLFASAYAWKACTLGQALGSEFRPRTPEVHQQIVQLLEQATSIDANDTERHRIMSRVALMQGQYAKSEHHLERALALNPNDPRLVVQRGINLTFLGEPEAAIPWIERAMRLDPFSAHRYYLDMVRALFMAKRPGEAMAVLERTVRSHWNITCGSQHVMLLLATGRRPVKPDNKPWRCGGICRSPPTPMGGSNGNGWKTKLVCATRWRKPDCHLDRRASIRAAAAIEMTPADVR